MSSLTGNMGMKSNTGSGLGGGVGGGNKVPKGYNQGQLQQFTPEQMQLFQQMFSHAGPESYLSKLAGGDQSFFDEMEAPAHRQFQGQIGQLASRFSGIGTGGRKGSGFQNSATAAASNFSQDLASRRQELQRQAIMDLQGLSSNLLQQKPYEQFLVQKPQQESSGWGGLIGTGLGVAAGGYFGGFEGALKGGKLGHAVGSGF